MDSNQNNPSEDLNSHNSATEWSIKDTSKLIEESLPASDSASAIEGINSLARRLYHAKFHYQEVLRLLNEFTSKHLTAKPLFVVALGVDEAARNEYQALMIDVEAHATACVLSMHAIPDLFAWALYHALNYRSTNALNDRRINANAVITLLAKNPSHLDVSGVLSSLCSSLKFKHIAALGNMSKHRNIVKPILSEDMTGSRQERHEFRFAAFTYDNDNYPELAFKEVLEEAYDIASRTVVEVGNKLNYILAPHPA